MPTLVAFISLITVTMTVITSETNKEKSFISFLILLQVAQLIDIFLQIFSSATVCLDPIDILTDWLDSFQRC